MTKLDDLYDKAMQATARKPPRGRSYTGKLILESTAPGASKRYYVVVGFHGKIISQIADGVLDGVRGISSCKEVVPLWLTVGRDAVIVMDAAATRRLNDLVDIKYEDPEFLLEDGMAVLHRLYDKRLDPDGGQQIMLRLMDEMRVGFRHVPGLQKRLEEAEVQYFDGRSLADAASDLSFAYMRYLESGGHPLSSVEEAARWLHGNAPQAIRGWNPRQGVKIMTISDWEHLVDFAARSLGSRYEEECEVLVEGNLRVPRGSYLYVVPGGYEERREALVEKWLPRLEEHYGRVFIIEPGERARARAVGKIHARSFERRKAKGLL